MSISDLLPKIPKGSPGAPPFWWILHNPTCFIYLQTSSNKSQFSQSSCHRLANHWTQASALQPSKLITTSGRWTSPPVQPLSAASQFLCCVLLATAKSPQPCSLARHILLGKLCWPTSLSLTLKQVQLQTSRTFFRLPLFPSGVVSGVSATTSPLKIVSYSDTHMR